jgi:hypothetical protein
LTAFVPWLLAILVSAALCGLTGLLLSMYYVPSTDSARDGVGRSLVIVEAGADVVLGPYGDTLALPGQRALVPNAEGSGVSLARASVDVHVHNASAGTAIRIIHRASALGMVLALVGMLVAMVWQAQAPRRIAWLVTSAALLVGIGAMWMGMLLPDGNYAAASHGVVRAAIDDGMAFGSIVEFIGGGHDAVPNRLARLLTLHGIGAGLVLAACFWWLWTHVGSLSLNRAAVVVVTGVAGCAMVLAWSEPTGHVAWYPFRLASVLQSWFGSELASYLAVALVACAVLLPWWNRNSPFAGRALVSALALAWLLAMMFA